MRSDLFSKYKDIWNEAEGFEKEVFVYLNEYYADDEYLQSWTHEDFKNFVFNFAENFMRWVFKLELKTLPLIQDFEWIEKIFSDFSERYEDDVSPSKVFKRIDLINRIECYERETNPQNENECDEKFEAECKTIIENETSELRMEAKEKIKSLKKNYPSIFENVEYVGSIYGFPLRASLIALKVGEQNIYVTYEDLMKWNNTEEFNKIFLKKESRFK